MFIIEGADSVGKTTLAHMIVGEANSRELFTARYSHMTRPPDHFDHCNNFKDMISSFAVQDRFHLGSIAYDDPPKLVGQRLIYVEEMLALHGSYVLIMISATDRWLKYKLLQEEREHMFDIAKVIEANEQYRRMVYAQSVAFDDAYHVDARGYPNRMNIKHWVDRWIEKLEKAGKI